MAFAEFFFMCVPKIFLISSGNMDNVRKLVQNGVKLNIEHPKSGKTPIYIASEHGL